MDTRKFDINYNIWSVFSRFVRKKNDPSENGDLETTWSELY